MSNTFLENCDLQLFSSCPVCGMHYFSYETEITDESCGVYILKTHCPNCRNIGVSTLIFNKSQIDFAGNIDNEIAKEVKLEDYR